MPIGQFQGKLETNHRGSTRGDNFWTNNPKTLWEKEVLMVTQKFELPALKEGHRYRLRVDRGQGVGAGDGFKVYLNGKELVETKEGLGRRAGGTIRGAWITKEFTEDFAKGPVTISAITFLRYGDRAIVQMPPVPQGIFSMWLEERKLPPLDDSVLRKAALYTPLLNAEWQARNDPSTDEAVENPPYYYDGKFIANPAVAGTWKYEDVVKSMDDFNPQGKKANAGRPLALMLRLNADGTSDSSGLLWSGDTLMNIEQRAALKMSCKNIDGIDYLFVETGGFGTKNPKGWQSTLTVFVKSDR